MTTYLQHLPETLKEQLRSRGALVGDRRPTKYPTWVTLEVEAGGFATGNAVARVLPSEETSAAFLERGGMDTLTDLLASGHYTIEYPENAALLTVAWLLKEPHREAEACDILEAIAPYLEELRLHPYPSTRPPTLSDRTGAFFTVRQLQEKLLAYGSAVKSAEENGATRWVRNTRQSAVANHYAPLQAAMVACLAGTIHDMPAFLGGDDTQLFSLPADVACAQSLVDRCEALRANDNTATATPKKHQAGNATSTTEILLAALEAVAASEAVPSASIPTLAARLRGSMKKRGQPGSRAQTVYLERTRRSACETAQTRVEKVQLLTQRLQDFPKDDFLPANIDGVVSAKVSPGESVAIATSLHPEFSPSILQLVRRTVDRTLEAHIQSGAIVSAEMIAAVVPHLFASAVASSIKDPSAAQLYALVAKAFARRRSLLLYNQQQVRMEELPWVRPLSALVQKGKGTVGQADVSAAPIVEATVREVVQCYLKHFPATIIPNKLVSALKDVMTKGAASIPLTEELATDIFCESFSKNFTDAAVIASHAMRHTLYSLYYGLEGCYASIEGQWEPYQERLRAHYAARGLDHVVSNMEFYEETHNLRKALLLSLGVTDLDALRSSDDGGDMQEPPISHEQVNAALIALSAFEHERSVAHQAVYEAATTMGEADPLTTAAKQMLSQWGLVPPKDGRRRFTVDNGRVIEAAMVITTHNLAQLAARGTTYDNADNDNAATDVMSQFDFAAAALSVWQTMLRKLQHVPSGRMQMLHAQRDLAYMWRQLLFFTSKHSPVAADVRKAVVEPMREAVANMSKKFARLAAAVHAATVESTDATTTLSIEKRDEEQGTAARTVNFVEFLERFYIQPLEQCAAAAEALKRGDTNTPTTPTSTTTEAAAAEVLAPSQGRCLTDDGTVILGYFAWNPFVAAGLAPAASTTGGDDYGSENGSGSGSGSESGSGSGSEHDDDDDAREQ